MASPASSATLSLGSPRDTDIPANVEYHTPEESGRPVEIHYQIKESFSFEQDPNNESPWLEHGPSNENICLEHGQGNESPLPRLDSLFGRRSPSLDSPRPYRESIVSSLMESVRNNERDYISMLLEYDANPNGVSLHVMERYAALFLRFRPPIKENEFFDEYPTRDDLLNSVALPQLSSLTTEEIEDRMWDGIAPFWCEEGFVEADVIRHGESMPSLVEASRSGSVEIFNQLIHAGADASFWMRPQFFIPNPPTESSLSVSSPIHAALQSRDMTMLKYLLDNGFDPNTMPLANPTRCLTPLMATIVYSAEFNREAFNLLSDCPNINMELRTPVYGVHILHFAVAGMDIDVLKHVVSMTPLRNAGTTALGHTLLHIACMPANALNVQRHSEIIFQSIHETRNLHALNDVHGSFLTDEECDNLGPNCSTIMTTAEDNYNQTMVFQYLWENGINDIEKEDVHGNTALHYLAGCRTVNNDLLTWLRDEPYVETAWHNFQNVYGYSPEALYQAGLEENRSNLAKGWRPWFEKPRAEGRRQRKQAIWDDLLSRLD